MAVVDPQHFPNSGDPSAVWWNGMMFLPGAGCYALQASWTGGSWTVHFAAGR